MVGRREGVPGRLAGDEAGSAWPTLVMATSALVSTVTLAEATLLRKSGSCVSDETSAVLEKLVPSGVDGLNSGHDRDRGRRPGREGAQLAYDRSRLVGARPRAGGGRYEGHVRREQVGHGSPPGRRKDHRSSPQWCT